jgi:hypothetical protein
MALLQVRAGRPDRKLAPIILGPVRDALTGYASRGCGDRRGERPWTNSNAVMTLQRCAEMPRYFRISNAPSKRPFGGAVDPLRPIVRQEAAIREYASDDRSRRPQFEASLGSQAQNASTGLRIAGSA